MRELLWSLDSLVIRENSIFGHGWVFHKNKQIVSIVLSCDFGVEPADSCSIAADVGKVRDDVFLDFSDEKYALNSGFNLYGAIKACKPIEGFDIAIQFSDGSEDKVYISKNDANVTFLNGKRIDRFGATTKQLYIAFKKSLYLIKKGKIELFLEKARRYLQGAPESAMKKASDLGDLFNPDEAKNVSLIVDHDLGGGANLYRNRLVDSMIAEGKTVIILTYYLPMLTHVLIINNRRLNIRKSIPEKFFLLESIRDIPLNEIIYNTGVSFSKPEDIPRLLVGIKKATGARLRILCHDFFIICPSHFLLDSEGVYCQIPDVTKCASCLPKNRQGFASLFSESDIEKWRAIWGDMMVAADEIVTFSNSTALLVKRAYPRLRDSQFSLIPHVVEHMDKVIPKINNLSVVCIGVIGHIGHHKGAKIVSDLADEIKRCGYDIKIKIIGSIEANCNEQIVYQSGPYSHNELPKLIEAAGINVIFFPSIWPETFSYVVQELIDMELPVAAFNLGAPPERLSVYDKGMVLSSWNVSTVLDELISFHHKIYLAS